ncbi:MAG: TAXI family TRAP transporter solute-binding subunit [Clostridiales bacterium]|jgi:TRAP transporter TAXI family solute receptor|nr:TAXI family TRAP transporter solute-binding subunit [Clostridiales bacterium]OPZ68316.1 MAG: putative aliphatic sulfonates-binding protein precursor [Firmicutes bacterium ADurb.Bin467]
MKKLLAIALALTLVLSASGALATTYVSLGTGGTAGTYYALGAEIASVWMNNIPDLNVTVQPTDASKDNIVFICEGDIDVATVQNDASAYAYAGNDFFGGEVFDDFYAIGFLYPEAVQLFVAADSDIKTIADLKGKNVGVGAAGSGTYMNAVQVLEAGGLKIEDINPQYLSFAETATAFQDMQIDAGFVTSGVPNTALIEVTTKREIRLLGLSDEQWEYMTSTYEFYTPYAVAAGTYAGMAEDTTVPAIGALLICKRDLDEQLVYDLTKTMFELKDQIGHAKAKELDPARAVTGVPVPFHPGAARYYAEKGLTVTVGE